MIEVNAVKLYITGIVAGGKTTLARKLSDTLGIPSYELDSIVHAGSGRASYKRTPEEQAVLIREIDTGGSWIIEGTYRESARILLELADTILFLDPPLYVRKLRIFRRYLRQRLGLERCRYTPNMKMLKVMVRWTRELEVKRPEFEAMLNGYAYKLIKAHSTDEALYLLLKR